MHKEEKEKINMIEIEKHFNTAGPVNMKEHYKLNPLNRWNLNEVMSLIKGKKYFLLHAPRQSGKTSCMLSLRDKINSEDDFTCLYINIESARGAKDNIKDGLLGIVSAFRKRIGQLTGKKKEIREFTKEIINNSNTPELINDFLEELTDYFDKPLVLLIDEIDSLHGDLIISILSQLRAGYDNRGEFFPWSIMLTGVLDIKDYRLLNIDPKHITGGSCFNVKSKSLTIGNFSRKEVETLYLEHTKETGQVFENDVFDLVYEYTDGQAWLINALAFEACFNMKENRDRNIVITKKIMREAKKRLILSKQTHLDQLADKLQQERIRNVIQPMIEGINIKIDSQDIIYCRDMGLIKKTKYGWVVANKIYQEVIPRELTESLQNRFLIEYPKPIWVNDDHSINIEKLMNLFVEFWRVNSEIWSDDVSGYTEVAPHLVFQGFLQRVGNGHGEIDREFALGTKRVDLYLEWESPVGEQRIIFELKVHSEHTNLSIIKKDGLIQTAEYADKCNATESHLLIFDRRENIDWKDKVFTETNEENGYQIKTWGL